MLVLFALAIYSTITGAVDSTTSPRRLVINGSMVSAPELPGVPLKLRGFNFWLALDQPITTLDTVVTDLFPDTNFARLVMIHWNDAASVAARGADCYAPNANTTGFLKPACLSQFDDAVAWATGSGIWTVLAVRSKAGQDHSPIWDNSTLMQQHVEMLGFLAARYSNVSNIAGYEVLAEPRLTDTSRVHAFHLTACGAVWEHDPQAACLIGAEKFYLRYNLNASYIIEGKPVIYAANYLTPKKYTNSKPGSTSLPPDFKYPGSKIKCGDLVEQKEISHVCPNGDKDAEITFDKDFLRLLAQPLFDFKTKFDVPVWVDQWGITGGTQGGNASIETYMQDALSLWEEGEFVWTQWIWRSYYTTDCEGYGVVCTKEQSKLGCGPWYPQTSVTKPLSKYLGGDGGGDGGPLPNQPPPSLLCKCIDEAKKLCSVGSASECKNCVWKHKDDLEADGCHWDQEHSDIVSGACNMSVYSAF